MISCENGKVSVIGSLPDVRAELATLINSLYHDILIKKSGMTPEEAKELILETVEQGFLTREQLENKVFDLLGDILKALAENLKGKDDN